MEHFVAGCFGGATGIVLSHPFDTIKARLQALDKNTVKYNNLFKGIIPPLIGTMLEKAIVFGSYDKCKNANIFSNNYINIFFSGCFAGFTCTIIVTPIEKIKIQLQNNPSENFMSVIKKENFKSIYNGWSACLAREIPGFGIYMSVFNMLKNNTENMTLTKTFAYGGISGICAWLGMYPSDVIKTNMQSHNISLKMAIKKIYNNDGFIGFYKGISFALIRAGLLHSGVFLGYEFTKQFIDKHKKQI